MSSAGSSRPGRAARALTGVDESILDTVPSERTRYTAMGGIVLGTAIIAMFSMTIALICVFGGFNPIVFVFVPAWGMFILFLDRWLMASPGVPRVGQRFVKLLPRFILAVMFGTIIAEPLLLGVFQTAVVQQVRDDRLAEIQQRQSDLEQCNPVPGTPAATGDAARDPKCEKLRLGVTTDSEAKQKELDDDTAQAATLKKVIDSDSAMYASLDEKARLECNGTSGPGLTGRVGQGPNCKRLRQEADQYHADHQIDQNNQKYADLNARITELTKEVGDSRSTAATRIDQGIKDEVAKYQSNQKKEIGLLERLRALGELVKVNSYVHTAEWALRIFFVAVDALPVLLKFLSGYTTYDRVAADRLTRQERAQRVASETMRRDAVMREELMRHVLNVEHSAVLGKVDFDARMRYVDVEVLQEHLTDQRTEFLLSESPTVIMSGISGATRMSTPGGSADHERHSGRA